MIEIIKEMYDIVCPRFITERVAMGIDDNGEWFVICRECELEPSEQYECIGISRCFNFFGVALGAKVTLLDAG